MNINAVRLVSVGVITGSSLLCIKAYIFLMNACTLILPSLVATHCHSPVTICKDYHVPNYMCVLSLAHMCAATCTYLLITCKCDVICGLYHN